MGTPNGKTGRRGSKLGTLNAPRKIDGRLPCCSSSRRSTSEFLSSWSDFGTCRRMPHPADVCRLVMRFRRSFLRSREGLCGASGRALRRCDALRADETPARTQVVLLALVTSAMLRSHGSLLSSSSLPFTANLWPLSSGGDKPLSKHSFLHKL